MYEKTKWKNFKKFLDENYNSNFPHDANLTKNEIDTHIGELVKELIFTIEPTVPEYKPQENSLNYRTSKN